METTHNNLNNAKQMYQYCIANNFGKGMNQNWGIKHFTLIQNSLQSDEEVLMCFIGLHNYISMTKHDNNFAYALPTNDLSWHNRNYSVKCYNLYH